MCPLCCLILPTTPNRYLSIFDMKNKTGFITIIQGIHRKQNVDNLYRVVCCSFVSLIIHIVFIFVCSLINVPMLLQLLRKRHIGNDIVTIVFQEPGALPFTPKTVRSQFQHVFIIVKVHNPCTDNVHYRCVIYNRYLFWVTCNFKEPKILVYVCTLNILRKC